MALVWKILLYLNITIYFLVVVRYYKHRYFKYFLALSLIDPIFIATHYVFTIDYSYYIPIAYSLAILFLPIKDRRHILLLPVLSLLLLPYFSIITIIPLLISIVAVAYLIFFFLEELLNELKKNSTIIFSTLFIIIDLLKDCFKMFLSHQHNELLTQNFINFGILGVIIPLLIVLFGPIKAVTIPKRWALLWKENRAHETKTIENNFFTLPNRFSCLTKMEYLVFTYLSEGLKPKEVAGKLHVSSRTIYSHCSSIKNKLNIPHGRSISGYAVENHDYIAKTYKVVTSDYEASK
jgi:DNA-binding CsgD family transcriptional regulator